MGTTAGMPRSPDGQVLLDLKLAAELCGVTEQTLRTWTLEHNPPPRDANGKFLAREFGHWIRRHQILKTGRGGKHVYLPPGVVIQSMSPDGGLPSAKKDYNAERTRKEAAAADKIEMENALSRGELVRASDVEKGWSDILSRVKTRVMQVPYTCAMMVVGDNDLASVQAKIRDVVRDALLELSTDWRDSGDDE